MLTYKVKASDHNLLEPQVQKIGEAGFFLLKEEGLTSWRGRGAGPHAITCNCLMPVKKQDKYSLP
jgi:hypothetical protein